MNGRRRDGDRPYDDRYKLWNIQDKPPDRDYDRRRHRSATVPVQSHDSKFHPTQPPDTRQPPRPPYRQEPHYPTTAPSASHQPVPGPSSSRPHPLPRSSTQNPPVGYYMPPYHTPTPTSIQPPPSSTSKGYSAPTAPLRRDNTDIKSHSGRRAQANPTSRPSYEQVSSAEDIGRTSRQPYPSRPGQSIQNTAHAPTHSTNLVSSIQDTHIKRSKDRDKERGDRDKERTIAELDRDRYRERYKSETHREKDRGVEGERHREQTRLRNDKRTESDSDGLVHPDNASKVSLPGKEGYQPSIRESITGHRRHRTEDGTARRSHAEPSHHQASVMHMQSTGPQAAAATGSNAPGVGSNPPPAPRVMPVYLPVKPQKSHHERHPSSAAHGGQSNSDADRASVKHHRMERHHSGAAAPRGDVTYGSNSIRERQQDGPVGPREDALEAKYSTQGAYYNQRQPDIALVTPAFNSSFLPHESRGHVGTIPVLVAGEGPADHKAHDALSKLPTDLRRDEQQDARYPRAPMGKPFLGRSQSSEVPYSRPEVSSVDRSHTNPAAIDFPNGRHYGSADVVPPQNTSKYSQVTNTVVDHQSSQPRSTHKTSLTNPQGGSRPQPLSSYVGHQNEPIKPVTAATPVPGPMTRATSNQPSVPPSPAQKINSSPAKIGSSLPSARPTTAGTSQPHLPGTHGINVIPIKRSPSTPPTPMDASQPYTRHAPNPSEPPSRPSFDRPEHVAPRMTTAQISNSSTVKSSWVVQTAQAEVPLKNGYQTREDKYLPSNRSHQPVGPPAVAHPQLREVLSSQNYPTQVAPIAQSRTASTQGSPKRSPGRNAPKDIHGGPRRTPDSSPHMSKVKEAPAPEQLNVPAFPSHVLGPPQIAVIDATPASMNQELPRRPQYNSSLLVPSYPAPPRVSRTTSGSRENQTQPQIVRTQSGASNASHRQTPVLPPQPVAPQASQTSSYSPNAGGFSPPPLPVPPPRVPGIDIAEDIFPVKLSPANPSGTYPPPPSPSVLLQPAYVHTFPIPPPTPMQTSMSNAHVDPIKNSPRMGERMSAAPPLLPTHSRESAVAAPAEVRVSLPSQAGATGTANGISQGIPASPHPPPSQVAPVGSTNPTPPKRPKVTIEEVPESPMFKNQWPATPLQTASSQTHAPTQSSNVPMQSSSPATKAQQVDAPVQTSSIPATKPKVPPLEANAPMQSSIFTEAKGQSSEANAPRSTPPSKPMDVPAQPMPSKLNDVPLQHTSSKPKDDPLRPTPTGATLTQSYASTPVQSTPASSRPPYSAPPMQSSFSSSYADTLHPTTFNTQPRGYQRPTDTLPSVRPPPAPTGTPAIKAQHMRSASQPPDVSQNALLDAASRETHMKLQSSRPLVSASAAAAQGARPAVPSPNVQAAYLDATSKGERYATTSTVTAATPQPQSLPTAEAHTNYESSRSIPSTSVPAAQATRLDIPPLNTIPGASTDFASKNRQNSATTAPTTSTSHPQSLPNGETYMKSQSSRPIIPPVTIPQGPNVRAVVSAVNAKSQVQDAPIPNDSTRYRGFLSSASRYASAMNPLYPATHRQPNPTINTQQSKPPLSTFSNSFHRTVSLPQPIPSSDSNPRPPSPRKFSQPLANSNTTSMQPFPGTPSQANAPSRSAKAPEPLWSRVAVSGHLSTPAPSRAPLPPAVNRTFSQESEVLLTPSSIAPSMPKTPQMSFNSVPQTTAPAMRQRQMSTDSRDSKKKPGFFGGLLRTMSGSKPLDSPATPSPAKTFVGGQKSPKAVAPPIQPSRSSSSAVRQSREKTTTSAAAHKTQAQTQTALNPPTSTPVPLHAPRTKTRTRIADPVAFPPPQPTREQKQPSSTSVFSQFIFLSKRKRTVSGASVDVCDGSNTANTTVGSPNVSQVQPLPPMPPVRDPMLAASEWRDKSEAEQQKRKKNRFRPGVTFDVEEDPPHPEKQKGVRLVRRKSGRGGATPAPR